MTLEGMDAAILQAQQSSSLSQLRDAVIHAKVLAMSGPAEPESATTTTNDKKKPVEAPKEKKPHVPKVDAPCSFWLKGGCNKGHRCKFAHPDPTASTASPAKEKVAALPSKEPTTPTTPAT